MDGQQEMERKQATAKHVAWPSCAWQLLSFFPFPVGHPPHPPCRRNHFKPTLTPGLWSLLPLPEDFAGARITPLTRESPPSEPEAALANFCTVRRIACRVTHSTLHRWRRRLHGSVQIQLPLSTTTPLLDVAAAASSGATKVTFDPLPHSVNSKNRFLSGPHSRGHSIRAR